VDNLTAGQEHFHGFFTKTEADGKYYVVTGGHHISILEIRGLDKFKRFDGKVVITPEDFRRVLKWEGERARKQIKGRAPIMECERMKTRPRIDGRLGKLEWPKYTSSFGSGGGKVQFKMGYDDKYLYLYWQGSLGPIQNYGDQWQRYFKTGGCLDLFLGTDPKADPKRRRPVAGDLRLLLTWSKRRGQVVLYQPMAPDGAKHQPWKTSTDAGGTTAFERVTLLADAIVAKTGSGRAFAVEAAVPLETLGLKITDGILLKSDWGVLTVDETKRVRERLYWTNKVANGTTDEAIEAKLEPHLWGYARFSVDGAPKPGSIDKAVNMMDELKSGKKKTAAEEDAILSDLEGD